MNRNQQKAQAQQRRARRTRSKIFGTAARPRLSVHRSLKHISAQLINDEAGITLGSATDTTFKGTKTEKGLALGKAIAAVAKEKGIAEVIFDRGAFLYHGRVKAVADGAREAGLKF
ncbi:MAG: 50S ribosomal protein L18 [Candidatus Kerfeldbacteria bacterium]|nr:50S ribosomal protein L18 [Candidatus Kerfeldbacteria bacterium]